MLPNSPYLVALIALVPGIVVWWTGRRIATRTSDPALPELLWAHRHRTRNVFLTSFFLAVFIGGRHAFWGIPLMAIVTTMGGYSLHRALGIDNASLPRQLLRDAKSIAGGLGFWIALTLIPTIVLGIDPRYRMLGLLLIPILLAWEHWYQQIWLRAHDAELVADDALVSRFRAIDARAGIASPRVYRVGGPDARFMNALAFPAIRGASVGLGNALIELLEPDEVAAIYAHELSHIEEFSPRKIRRHQLVTRSLIVGGVLLSLGVAFAAPDAAWVLPWVWPVLALSAIALRGKGSKNRETDSDLRAAALCGDAEVMIRALIKVHVHGFIPRRWDVDFERHASHPSLTRRIQALRGEAASSPAVSGAPILLETSREGSVVAFDGARAYWFDGVPADAPRDLDALRALATSSRSVAWTELVELRVVARGDGRALHAKHRNADSWSVPLDSSHVEAVQKALDVVDVRLGRELGKRTVLDMRLVATLMITAILWTGQLGVLVLPAVVAVFRPTTIMLAGLGSMAVVSGILGQLDDWSAGGELSIRYAVLMLLGAAALWIAWSRARRDDKRDGLRIASITFGGMAALMLVVVALTVSEAPIRDIIQRPALRTLSLSFLGMATVLLFVRTRAAKLGAAAAIALAALTLVPSIAALDVFRSDRFTHETAAATEVARVALEGNAMALELSPNGNRFLVRGYGNDDDEEEDDPRAGRAQYTVGSFDGAKRRVDALQAALVDEAHILVLRRADRALELRLEGDDSAAVWTVPLPVVRRPVLTVSPASRRWTILGNDPSADSMIVVSGALTGGEPAIRWFASGRRARSEEDMYDMGQAFSVGDRIVNPTFEYKKSGSGMTALLTRTMPRVALWERTSSGEQKIGELDGMPQCGAADAGQVLCVVMQQLGRGQLWALDETGPARPLGSVPVGDMGRVAIGPGTRVSSIRRSGAAVVAADIEARKAWTIKLPSDSGFALEARTVPGRVVVLRLDRGKATLLAYRVDGL